MADRDDAFSKENYKRMEQLLRTRVSEKRFFHSKGVAKTAGKLAEVYGFDPDIACMAGILHDWDKGYSVEELRARARDLNVSVTPQMLSSMPWLLHGPTAAAALERDYPEFGEDVFQAIARHTTGAEHMTPLDCIIYVSDIIEPSRTYSDKAGVARLRALVGKVPLEQLYFEGFKYTLRFLIDNNRLLAPHSIDIWNALVLKFATAGHVS